MESEKVDYDINRIKNNIWDDKILVDVIIDNLKMTKNVINKLNNLSTNDFKDIVVSSVSNEELLKWNVIGEEWKGEEDEGLLNINNRVIKELKDVDYEEIDLNEDRKLKWNSTLEKWVV